MQIDQYIADLLRDHDCVIVPDFGGFVGNYASAKINPTNNRIDPPHRNISYNKYLVHNDGLLASYVAQKQELEYESALRNVRDYAVYLKDELKEKKQVSIEKVGVLYQQANGTFRFEQVKNPEFFIDGFGLESFFAKSVSQPQVAVEPAKAAEKVPKVAAPIVVTLPVIEAEPIAEETEEPKETKRRLWPMVAAAAVLPFIGYAVWVSLSTPLFRNSSDFQYSDLNPFTEKVCRTYSVRNASIADADLSAPDRPVLDENAYFDTAYVDLAIDKTLVVKLREPKEINSSSNDGMPYHIVGGCFGDEMNAISLVSKFRARGKNAAVIDLKGGLYRVSVQSFGTKKEAVQALASIQNEISGAWVLYK